MIKTVLDSYVKLHWQDFPVETMLFAHNLSTSDNTEIFEYRPLKDQTGKSETISRSYTITFSTAYSDNTLQQRHKEGRVFNLHIEEGTLITVYTNCRIRSLRRVDGMPNTYDVLIVAEDIAFTT